jgi:hypothetical protein
LPSDDGLEKAMAGDALLQVHAASHNTDWSRQKVFQDSGRSEDRSDRSVDETKRGSHIRAVLQRALHTAVRTGDTGEVSEQAASMIESAAWHPDHQSSKPKRVLRHEPLTRHFIDLEDSPGGHTLINWSLVLVITAFVIAAVAFCGCAPGFKDKCDHVHLDRRGGDEIKLHEDAYSYAFLVYASPPERDTLGKTQLLAVLSSIGLMTFVRVKKLVVVANAACGSSAELISLPSRE